MIVAGTDRAALSDFKFVGCLSGSLAGWLLGCLVGWLAGRKETNEMKNVSCNNDLI